MNSRFDIIVAGAGLVGTCTAVSLARCGFSVAIIEAAPMVAETAAEDDVYDLRVSAISPASQRILSRIGAWEAIDQNRVCHYEQMSIWHEHGDASVDFDCAQLGRDSLGAIVENSRILGALLRVGEKQANIEWFRGDRIASLEKNSALALALKLESGIHLQTQLLVVADGRYSNTRSLAGFDLIGGSYDQSAIVANVETEIAHQYTARQRFLETGPLAFLPLANGQSSIVWSCDALPVLELMQLDDDSFREALGAAFEYRLGKITGIGERRSFPLGWHGCEQWLRGRVLLIGDAAHGVHPLAGQGLNLGFSDVEVLTDLIGGLENPWNQLKLRQYERQRKSETLVATHLFSWLKHWYGVDHTLPNLTRDLGMRLIQASPWCKRQLMHRAMRNMC